METPMHNLPNIKDKIVQAHINDDNSLELDLDSAEPVQRLTGPGAKAAKDTRQPNLTLEVLGRELRKR
jgi:hypothetical protein